MADIDRAALERAVQAGKISRDQARMLAGGSKRDDEARRMPTCPILIDMVRRARNHERLMGKKMPTAEDLNETAVTFSKDQREQIWKEDPNARIHDFVWHDRLPRLLAEDVETLVKRVREHVFLAEQALGDACTDEEVQRWILENDLTLREWADDDCLEYSTPFARMAVRNLDPVEWTRMIGQLRILADLQRGRLSTSDATLAISEFFRSHIANKRTAASIKRDRVAQEEGRLVTGSANVGMT